MRFVKGTLVICLLLLCGCGPQTFHLSKDASTGYFGPENRALYALLCRNGELKEVLRDAALPDDAKNDLYEFYCSERREDKVISLYMKLTPSEKMELKRAFIRHRYAINYESC